MPSSKPRAIYRLDDACFSGARINPIQRTVHRQLGKHDDLLNRQRGIALRSSQLIGEITGQGVG